jgi:hypothetical protein
MVGNKGLRHIFRRHFRSRLDEMVAPNYALLLDYPVKASPRHGYGKPPHPQIAKILEVERSQYAKRLSRFCELKDYLTKIAHELPGDALEPCWIPHRFFCSLDAVALYGMLDRSWFRRFHQVCAAGYSGPRVADAFDIG